VASIDAVLEAATACLCGCGTHLGGAGASLWWASERCQARWQAHAVGATPDPDGPGRDMPQDSVPATRPDPAARGPLGVIRDAGWQPHPVVRGPTTPTAGWVNAGRGPLPWVRSCDTCRAYTDVIDALSPPAGSVERWWEPGPTPAVTVPPEQVQVCAGCGTVWDPPVMLAEYCPNPDMISLSCGNVHATMPAFGLTMPRIPIWVVAHAWLTLHEAVLQRITWRDPCQIPGCVSPAKQRWLISGQVSVYLPDQPVYTLAHTAALVCHTHSADLVRAALRHSGTADHLAHAHRDVDHPRAPTGGVYRGPARLIGEGCAGNRPNG
jgi:hypothetical protein